MLIHLLKALRESVCCALLHLFNGCVTRTHWTGTLQVYLLAVWAVSF